MRRPAAPGKRGREYPVSSHETGASCLGRAARRLLAAAPAIERFSAKGGGGSHVSESHQDRRRARSRRLRSPPTGASAQGKLQDVLSRGKLIVGTGSTNPPWHFRDEKGELVGFDIDDRQDHRARACSTTESKIEFVNQASDARIPNIVTDKVDIACQFITVTAARAQQVAFTVPYYREGVSLMMVTGGKYADYAALKAAGNNVTVSVLQNVFAERHGQGGVARGQGRPVRKRRPDVPGAEFRPCRRRRDGFLVAALLHEAERQAATSIPATAGTRRPIPASSSRAIRTG